MIFPRRASPAAMVVDRCRRSKVWCLSRNRTMRDDDLRPRALAISYQQYGCGWAQDTGMRPQSQRNVGSFSCRAVLSELLSYVLIGGGVMLKPRPVGKREGGVGRREELPLGHLCRNHH